MQYTIRNITPQLDQVLRKRAKQSGKSFNETVLESLNQQIFGQDQPPERNDFDWLFGASTLDEGFDEVIRDMSKIDDKLWQ